MLYVVKIELETVAGIEKMSDIKVFQSIKSAEQRWYTAWNILEGRRPEPQSGSSIISCSLYEAGTSDVRQAADHVRTGVATLLRSDQKPFPSLSLDDPFWEKLFADLPRENSN